ncbi:transposase [Streptomyces sp. NPDC058770]|uniref:transposase n=1 Tax=Streptomyces sp. NPDC058770 TaxID=3346631 RepID=UPI003693BCD0
MQLPIHDPAGIDGGISRNGVVHALVFTDAIHARIRDGAVANRPVHVALAVTVEGRREILGRVRRDGGRSSACAPGRRRTGAGRRAGGCGSPGGAAGACDRDASREPDRRGRARAGRARRLVATAYFARARTRRNARIAVSAPAASSAPADRRASRGSCGSGRMARSLPARARR